MDFVTSDDELASVLAHEMGHSLLQHGLRRSQDINSTVAQIAVIVGAFWKSNRQALNMGAAGVTAVYGRLDEEEADAIGAAIAHHAGYDPIQGAGLFGRMKQQDDEKR